MKSTVTKIETYVSSERYVTTYRGVGIYRYVHSGMYTALTSQGSRRADTLAGIKQAIREIEKP